MRQHRGLIQLSRAPGIIKRTGLSGWARGWRCCRLPARRACCYRYCDSAQSATQGDTASPIDSLVPSASQRPTHTRCIRSRSTILAISVSNSLTDATEHLPIVEQYGAPGIRGLSGSSDPYAKSVSPRNPLYDDVWSETAPMEDPCMPVYSEADQGSSQYSHLPRHNTAHSDMRGDATYHHLDHYTTPTDPATKESVYAEATSTGSAYAQPSALSAPGTDDQLYTRLNHQGQSESASGGPQQGDQQYAHLADFNNEGELPSARNRAETARLQSDAYVQSSTPHDAYAQPSLLLGEAYGRSAQQESYGFDLSEFDAHYPSLPEASYADPAQLVMNSIDAYEQGTTA